MKGLIKFLLFITPLFLNSIIVHAQIDAGFDITYAVGSGDINLFNTASTTEGTWTVTGGTLNGSLWSVDYQSFTEPYVDYIATLTIASPFQTDSKTIRAYNKLDPSIVTREPYIICGNGGLSFRDLKTIPTFEPFNVFRKEYFYQVEGSSSWVQFNKSLDAVLLGSGNHKVRERYLNVVNSFIFTDVETNVTVNDNPVLFWSSPVLQLCTTSTPIDIADYINTTTNVIFSSDAGAAFTGTIFNPSISGTGQYQINATTKVNDCPTAIGVVIKVVDPCN